MSGLPSFTQVGAHLANSATADAIRLRTGGGGVLLGADEGGHPVTISLFRAEPTLIVAVGSPALAELIGFRALAVGATVVVTSVRPSAWTPLASAAGVQGAVDVRWPDSRVEQRGSSLRPRLMVVDSMPIAAVDARPVVPPWSTLLAVRERLASRDQNLLRRADLVLTQALSLQESTLLCGALNVTEYAHALTVLPAHSVAVISHGTVRSARLRPTAIERQVIGGFSRS